MKVHLTNGVILEVFGDTPVKQDNGLMRFDKRVDRDQPLGRVLHPRSEILMMYKPTRDPLIPIDKILYIEKQ